MALKDKKICYSNGLPDHIQVEMLKKESEWERRGQFKYKDVKEAVLELLKYSNKGIVTPNNEYLQIPMKKFKEIIGDFTLENNSETEDKK